MGKAIEQDTRDQANVFGLIRFVSAIAIVLFHYNKLTGGLHDDTRLPLYSVLHWAYIYGGALVELFFMISGFCFVLFYKDRIEKNLVKPKFFIIHRIGRGIPAYWLATVAIVVFTYISIKALGSTLTGAGRSITDRIYLLPLDVISLNFANPINGVAWFLAVNLLCYAWYYMILYFLKNDRKNRIIIAIGIIVSSAFVMRFPGNALTNIARGIAAFGLGGVLQ